MRFLLLCSWVVLTLSFTPVSVAEDQTVIGLRFLPGHVDRSGKGVLGELVQTIYAACGQEVKIKLFVIQRHQRAFDTDMEMDAVGSLMPFQVIKGAYASRGVVEFPVGAAVLNDTPFEIKELSDLKSKRVLGFPNAGDYLPKLKALRDQFESYKETRDPSSQYRLLALKKYDAFISDGLLFAWGYQKVITETTLPPKLKAWPKMKFIPLFDVQKEVFAFRTAEKRDQFNACFKIADDQGLLHDLMQSYIRKYDHILQNAYAVDMYTVKDK